MDRDEILTRYRRYREIGIAHHSAALKHVSRQSILDNTGRLGLRQGRDLVADSENELMLAFDLAIYAARHGHSRAIDRYAKAAPIAPGSDEALVLDAMRTARFGIYRVQRRHDTVGLVVLDIAREIDIWLVDEGLEQTTDEEIAFAARLCQFSDFAMTSGMVVPVDHELLEQAFDAVPVLARGEPEEIMADSRFITTLYRAVIARGYFALGGDEEE